MCDCSRFLAIWTQSLQGNLNIGHLIGIKNRLWNVRSEFVYTKHGSAGLAEQVGVAVVVKHARGRAAGRFKAAFWAV